jgi:LPS-assembly lipoprotein
MKHIALITFLLLAGCSFTPLHKATEENYDILAQIKLGSISASKAYIFRNYLIEELNPNRIDSEQKFILDISVRNSTQDLLEQKDTTISRSEMTVVANYQFKDLKNKIIKSGEIKSTVGFEQNLSSYSSFIQEKEAYKNALKDIARSLKSRIIVSLLNKNLIINENISK